MASDQRPLIVYDRIDANRRNTRFLLAAMPALLLPFAAGIAAYLSPWLPVWFQPLWWTVESPARLELPVLLLSLGIRRFIA